MDDTYTNKFRGGDTDESDRDSGLGMNSGENSTKLDSAAQSVRSWGSQSQDGSWNDESDDEDDDALGALDAWLNDEVYVKSNDKERQREEAWQKKQKNDKIIQRLQEMKQEEAATNNLSPRERARKASRELYKEKHSTSGGGTRSMKREHIIIKWMMRITHLNKDMEVDFADWVQDGTVLILLMTTLDFNSVEREKFKCGSNPIKDRIEGVRKSFLNYGVDPKYIFKLEDVQHKTNTPKVIRCLEEVAKISQQETHIVMDTLRKDKLYT